MGTLIIGRRRIALPAAKPAAKPAAEHHAKPAKPAKPTKPDATPPIAAAIALVLAILVCSPCLAQVCPGGICPVPLEKSIITGEPLPAPMPYSPRIASYEQLLEQRLALERAQYAAALDARIAAERAAYYYSPYNRMGEYSRLGPWEARGLLPRLFPGLFRSRLLPPAAAKAATAK
jgi:hypothetical protein